MAGIVPMSSPPAYADRLAAQQTGFDENRSRATVGALDANAAALGSILGNIDKIAEVAGGEFSPNNLLQMFAGAEGRPLDHRFAGAADRLRQAQAAADVAATGRKYTGTADPGIQRDPNAMFIDVYDEQGNLIGTQSVKDEGQLAALQRMNPKMTLKWRPTSTMMGENVVSGTKGKGSGADPVVEGTGTTSFTPTEEVVTNPASEPPPNPMPQEPTFVPDADNTRFGTSGNVEVFINGQWYDTVTQQPVAE